MAGENELIIYFPGSPQTPVKITRAGRDPIFNEEQGPQHVNVTWMEDENYTDPETGEQAVRQVTRGTSFKGPMV